MSVAFVVALDAGVDACKRKGVGGPQGQLGGVLFCSSNVMQLYSCQLQTASQSVSVLHAGGAHF